MKANIGRTVIGGSAGTVAITLMMYFVSPMMGVKMDIAASLGKLLGGSSGLGMAMHFINGTIIFPLTYAFLPYRILPGSGLGKRRLLGAHTLVFGTGDCHANDGRRLL